MNSNKKVISIAMLMITMLISGCVTSPGPSASDVVINAYVPPNEERVISELVNQSGVFALAVDPEVVMPSTTSDRSLLQKVLVDSMLQALNDENYICVQPVVDWAAVKLRMQVVDYDYKRWFDEESSMFMVTNHLQVSFIINNEGSDRLTKVYEWEEPRSARNKQQLPSQRELISKLSQNVVLSFIEDISPQRTFQMRKLESFPSELSYLGTYIQSKNYISAVEEMEAFSGEKDEDYFYDLAILYEAIASDTEKPEDMKKAKENYSRCMKTGGDSDKVMVESKVRFDESYRQFSRLQNQRNTNKSCELDNSLMF